MSQGNLYPFFSWQTGIAISVAVVGGFLAGVIIATVIWVTTGWAWS